MATVEVENLAFLLDDYPSPFAVNHLFFVSLRVIDNVRVCNEESLSVINPDCSNTACRWAGAAERCPLTIEQVKKHDTRRSYSHRRASNTAPH